MGTQAAAGLAVEEASSTATIALLFTDIEGSTRLLQELGPGYTSLLLTHQALLRAAFAEFGGREVSTEGDAFFVTFERTSDAIAAALAGQRALLAHRWPEGAEVRVRMGVHAGEVQSIAGELVGVAIHAAARITSAGHGSQVLVSQVAAELAGALPDGASWIDLGEQRFKDFATPLRVLQLAHDDLPSSFPSLRTLAGARRTNLPAQVTAFVGRDAEVVELRELVAAARLVTVTGAGGAGKTRLALRVAAEPGPTVGGGGVWLVDLAPVAEPAAIAPAIATALSMPEGAAANLAVVLGSREELLVMDNCEHLVADVARTVSELLAHCPNLRVLATSRERLGLPGEIAWRLPSMTVSEAALLFAARARDTNPRFALTEDNQSQVESICARLDGIPLAVELAAARLSSLGLDQLASRLDHRFKLLTRGSRVAVPRQQTLEATVDWSCRLLDDPARRSLARLSVFAGGFTLEAAEAVCNDAVGEGVEVFDVVDQLVAKSLVVADEAAGSVRYRLLETIRHYAMDRLAEAGEVTSARAAHLAWVVELALGAESALWLFAGDYDQAAGRCEADAANIRAALGCALETGRVGDAATIALALVMWWAQRAPREGYDWCDRILGTDAAGELTAPLAFGRYALATHLPGEVQLATILAHTRDALVTRGTPDRWRWVEAVVDAWAAADEARQCSAKGQPSGPAMARCRDAVVRTRALEHHGERGMFWSALQALCVAEGTAGNIGAARAAGTEAIALSQRLNSAMVESRIRDTVAELEFAAGELDLAWEHASVGLALARRNSDLMVTYANAWRLMSVAVAREDFGTAYEMMREVNDVSQQRVGDRDSPDLEGSLAWLAYLAGKLDVASGHVAVALALAPDLLSGSGLAETLAGVHHTAGEVHRATGDLRLAWQHLARGCEQGTTASTPDLLTAMGGVRIALGDAPAGAVLLGAGAALRGEDKRSAAERAVADQDEATAREALGDEAFDAAAAEGASLDAEHAIARAMAMPPPAAPASSDLFAGE
jgi:predicted ATPase/class 3 adenylate cyclase